MVGLLLPKLALSSRRLLLLAAWHHSSCEAAATELSGREDGAAAIRTFGAELVLQVMQE